MKRFFIVFLALCMTLSVFACGGTDKTTPDASETEAPAATPAPEATPAPAEPAPVEEEPAFAAGLYGLIAYEVEGVKFEGDLLVNTGIADSTLLLNADHTGEMILMGQLYEIGWTNEGDVTVSDVPYYFIAPIDAETLAMTMGGATLTFRLGAASASSEPEQPTEAPAEPEATAQPTGEAALPGAPYGDSDGVVDRATLAALYRWMNDMESGFRYSLTFDQISAAAGKQGRDNGDNDGKTQSANWSDAEDDSITVTFREQDGLWTCVAIAIKGISKSEYSEADISAFPKMGSSTPAGTNPTESVTIDAKVGYTDAKVAVTVAVPKANWFAEERSGSVRIWCAPSAEKASSSQSYIIVECKESLDKIDFYQSSFENLTELAPRTIAGVEMQGRAYYYIGMNWVEYYGEIADGVWASIRLTGVNTAEGTETMAIVDSITIAVK